MVISDEADAIPRFNGTTFFDLTGSTIVEDVLIKGFGKFYVKEKS